MIEAKALPTHDQLVSLIQFELDRAEKLAARPGWTAWALWGALATVAWLAVSEIYGSTLAWDAVGLWFLLGSMLADLIGIVPGLLNQESNLQNHGHRFIIANRSLGSARSLFALLFLRYVILATLCISKFSSLSPWIAYSVVSYTVMAALFFGITLALSFSTSPLPSTQASTRPKNIAFALLALLAVTVTVGSIVTLIGHPNSFSLENIRTGGLLWTASMLVILLSVARPKSPLIQPLIDIRRDLGLNNIDLSTAKRQIEIAIHGLQVADILQHEVSAVLTPLRLALNAEEQISQDIQALLAQLPTDPNSTLTSEQANLTSAVLRSVESLQDDARKRVETFQAASILFASKATFIIGTNPNTKTEIDVLKAEIDSALNDLRKRATRGGESLKKLGLRVHTIEPDKQQDSKRLPPP